MTIARRTTRTSLIAAIAIAGSVGAALSAMTPAQKTNYDTYVAAAKAADPAFKDFSAERGKTFFLVNHVGGRKETPSCTSCHTTDPTKAGRTRAGKEIAPMAASANPKRFSDAAEMEKWFKRNCSDVLGRECTVLEKGDVLAYLLGL